MTQSKTAHHLQTCENSYTEPNPNYNTRGSTTCCWSDHEGTWHATHKENNGCDQHRKIDHGCEYNQGNSHNKYWNTAMSENSHSNHSRSVTDYQHWWWWTNIDHRCYHNNNECLVHSNDGGQVPENQATMHHAGIHWQVASRVWVRTRLAGKDHQAHFWMRCHHEQCISKLMTVWEYAKGEH